MQYPEFYDQGVKGNLFATGVALPKGLLYILKCISSRWMGTMAFFRRYHGDYRQAHVRRLKRKSKNGGNKLTRQVEDEKPEAKAERSSTDYILA